MHICIIGAGIIGSAAAWELAQHGHHITLLEAREGVGLETSYANAGQLSYSYVAPLADPSVLPNLPKWLLDSQSPLQYRLRFDTQQWRWGLAFLLACTTETARQTTAHMLALSHLSRGTLAQWQAQTPMEFAWREAGKLVIYRSPQLLEKASQAASNTGEQRWSAAQCLEREPALAGFGTHLAGGIYAADSAVADCHALSQTLAKHLSTLPGNTLRTGARVAALECRQGHITAARLDNGERIEADHFVLSNALGARLLLRALGDDVPLYGLKGYSLSLPLAADDPSAPHTSVTDYERRIVYARIGDTLRIAAMVDMGDTHTQPNPARVALLKRQIAEVFPHLPLDAAQIWAGLRPATPDSKPRIGRSQAASNLWLNVGHGALGFTLACGSAVLLRSLMEESRPPINPVAFQP